MNATRKNTRQNENADQSMKRPFIYSLVFHIVVFIIAAFGLPFLPKPDLAPISIPIDIELVEISDITQTNRVAPPKREDPKPEEKPPAPAKKEAPPAPEPEPVIEPPKPPEIKEPEPPKPKPEEKKEPPKKEEPKRSLDDLLKDLTPREAEQNIEAPAQEGESNNTPASQIATLGERLTISEQDAIGQQLRPCWNLSAAAGSRMAEELIVDVRVFMNKDGSIGNTQVLDTNRYNRDSHFRTAADAAERALRNPRCTPLKYPPEKYEQLKVFIFRFDPSQML